MRHNTAAWSDRGLPAPELRTDADADVVGDVPVHEDPPDVFPDLFEEEDDEPDMPEPEPEDAHEEAPVPVLNRFLALRIVYGDGLRRTPSVK